MNQFDNNEKLYIPYISFDTETNAWTSLKSMNAPRTLASATVFNGCIYVAGGDINTNASSPLTSVESYDAKLDKWTQMPPLDMPGTRHAIMESNGILYAMGGQERVTKKFDPLQNRWTEVCDWSMVIIVNMIVGPKLESGSLRCCTIILGHSCVFFANILFNFRLDRLEAVV